MVAILAVLALAVNAPAAQELRALTPAEMKEDLFRLTEKLTSLHAGLHRYATAEEIEEAFGSVLLAAEEGPRDVLWFFRLVSELVAHVRCGHTNVRLGERDELAALERRGMLPFQVLLADERAWIRDVLDPESGLYLGQELLAVDGLDLATIRARFLARSSGDGYIETGKERRLESDFARAFVLLVAERKAGPYELRIGGSLAPVNVSGIPSATYDVRRRRPVRSPLVELEILEGGVGVLDFDAFGDPPGGEPRLPAQLEAAFRRLREEKVPHLVLDLRGNGGGRDQYGAALVSYLSPQPFGYFERITVTPDYAEPVRIEERDGLRLMLDHGGLQVQQPAELRFEGEACILIDGETFSTAADVATVAHANRLATFFGEETGGGYEGNNSGSSELLRLANSGLGVSVPHWNYRTAGIGPGHEGRGVEPDVAVRATIEDVLAGRDAVLERALEHVRSGSKR